MDCQLIELVYQKYETYSMRYIISIDLIEQFIDLIDTKNLSYYQINEKLDKIICEKCYYNLLTTLIDDFQNKLKHNIKLARQNKDSNFLFYLSHKFQIKDDLLNVNLDEWQYESKKIKLQLKSTKKEIEKQRFYVPKTLLAELLQISDNQRFKHTSEIIRLIHKYIHINQLQNRINKNQIDPDEPLANLLLPLHLDATYTYYNLTEYVKHLIKSIEPDNSIE